MIFASFFQQKQQQNATLLTVFQRLSFFLFFFASPRFFVAAEWFSRDGDIVIGFVLPAHDTDKRVQTKPTPSTSTSATSDKFNFYSNGTTCTGPLVHKRALLVTQFRRIIDGINTNNANLLGGLKLGYQIIDSCSQPSIAAAQAAKWMAAKVDMDARNYSVSIAARGALGNRPMPFILGAYSSGVTAQLASMLAYVDMPLVDFGSTSPSLSDRSLYPLFARTSPSDRYQATAIAALMFNYLHWNCTHLVYSEGVYGETGAAALREELTKSGICRATDVKAPVSVKYDRTAVRTMSDIVSSIARKAPTSAAIICFCEEGTLQNLLIALRDFYASQPTTGQGGRRVRFLVVASDTWGISLPLDDVQSAANAAITLKVGNKDVPDFQGWVSSSFQTLISPQNIDPWMDEYVQDKFSLSHAEIAGQRARLSLDAKQVPKDDYLGLMTSAVYIGVHALRLLLEESCQSGSAPLVTRCSTDYIRHAYNGRRLYALLPNATKFLDDSLKIKFQDNMDGQALYYFYTYRSNTNSYTDFGSWDLENKGVGTYPGQAESVKYWPDTSQLIQAICPPKPNEQGDEIGIYQANTCPSIFYYPNPDALPASTNLSVQCAYYCNENRVFNVCTAKPTTVVVTTPSSNYQLSSTIEPDSKSATITGLAVVLAVCACAFIACLILLIYASCKCRDYRKRLKDAQNIIKINAPSVIASDKTFNNYNGSLSGQNPNGAYAPVFVGSTTSSLTYARRTAGGAIEIVEIQPTLMPTSLQDELYLVPQSKTSSQISQTTRIKRIVSALGGTDEYSQMIERFFVPNNELIWGEAFADGKFAFVYHGILRKPLPDDGTGPVKNSTASTDLPVAVKVLKSRDGEDLLDFLKEAYLMQTFRHPNVMQLIGVSLLFDQPHIIVPLMSNGNLRDFVRQYIGSLSNDRLLNFCLQIAIGMEYLSRNKFIHRDLAARNVLVDSEGLLKIADFGMSRHLQQSDYYKPVTVDRPLPIRWHPPESLQMRVFDERSDVWSFGVVMWEIYSGGMQPYGGLSNNEVVEHIAAGNRLPKPERCPDEVYAGLMLKCWQVAVKDRPSFAQLIQLIRAIPPSDTQNNPTSGSQFMMRGSDGNDNAAFAGSSV